MADYATTMPVTTKDRASWPAIFAGTFVFIAIEMTFLALGIAIFGGSVYTPITGITVWEAVVTLFAFYFAGRAVGRLSGTTSRNIAVYHGLTVFGMGIFAALLIAWMVLSPAEMAASGAAGVHITTARTIFVEGGYALFSALFVSGFLCALGAAQETKNNAAPPAERPGTPSNLRSVA